MPTASEVVSLRKPCPACGVDCLVRALPLGESEVWRCPVCGLGQTVPTPAESDGREHFAEDPATVAQGYANPKDQWWHRFIEAPLDVLQRAGAGSGLRLLDVGCNLGYFVAKARNRGYRVRGIDGSFAAAAFGGKHLGLDLICARIEQAPIRAASQDIVVLNHVLEHLPDPLETLRCIRRWLRPEGFLLIGLPNFASPIARLAGARWDGLVPSQHIWHFTPTALKSLVRGAGFAIIRWETCMLAYTPRGVSGWSKWVVRRILELGKRADNLILVAQHRTGEH